MIASNKKPVINFFAAQDAERKLAEKSRSDKHLLPDIAVKIKNGKNPPDLDYGEIHLIFNHKNIWANMQHSDPVKNRYELHDDNLWLPFVRDTIYPHKYDKNGEEIIEFKKWQKFDAKEEIPKDDPNDPDRLNIHRILEAKDFRVKGEFLQPF